MAIRIRDTVRVGKKKRGKEDSTYHHGDLRNSLLEAALELVHEKGPYHLSLREIARRAGVSHAAPYRHFADKNALLAAVALDGFEKLGASLTAAVGAVSADPVRALIASAWGYVAFATAHPSHLQVMFGGAVENTDPESDLSKCGDSAFQILYDIVARGQAQGDFRAGDTQTLALAAWSLVHGLSQLISHHGVATADQAEHLTETLARLLCDGLLLPGAEPPA